MSNLPYPIEPIEITLSDGKIRRLRFTAGALKRLEQRNRKLANDPDSTAPDSLAAAIWEGLLPDDRAGLGCPDDILDLIDARAIDYLNGEMAKALPKTSDSQIPAGEV